MPRPPVAAGASTCSRACCCWPAESALTLSLVFPPEDRDRQTVERFVRRLRHDRVHHLTLWMLTDPRRDFLAQVLPLLRHGSGQNLHALEHSGRVVLVLCHHLIVSLPGEVAGLRGEDEDSA